VSEFHGCPPSKPSTTVDAGPFDPFDPPRHVLGNRVFFVVKPSCRRRRLEWLRTKEPSTFVSSAPQAPESSAEGAEGCETFSPTETLPAAFCCCGAVLRHMLVRPCFCYVAAQLAFWKPRVHFGFRCNAWTITLQSDLPQNRLAARRPGNSRGSASASGLFPRSLERKATAR
jgi:hypothetical protein